MALTGARPFIPATGQIIIDSALKFAARVCRGPAVKSDAVARINDPPHKAVYIGIAGNARDIIPVLQCIDFYLHPA